MNDEVHDEDEFAYDDAPDEYAYEYDLNDIGLALRLHALAN